ncbi:hypothetical protein [Streptomyces niveus]|uniref:hypothetical protein n=1 Tax=Streptomyces niveus TaxID=193462 RepID=UPI0034399BD7
MGALDTRTGLVGGSLGREPPARQVDQVAAKPSLQDQDLGLAPVTARLAQPARR